MPLDDRVEETYEQKKYQDLVAWSKAKMASTVPTDGDGLLGFRETEYMEGSTDYLLVEQRDNNSLNV